MRVTNSMMLTSSLANMNSSLGRLQRSQVKLSTGRQLTKPSDDPSGAATAMKLRTEIRRSDQMARALDNAKSWSTMADHALVNGADIMSRIKTVAVRAANTGANSDASREALTHELGVLKQELLSVANTKFLGRSVFAGTADGDAYDATGVFQGNDAPVFRDVAPGTTIQVNATGPEVFGDPNDPNANVFEIIDRLVTAVGTGDNPGMDAEHALLDVAAERLASATGDIGARGARIEQIDARQQLAVEELKRSLSQVEDADLAESVMEVDVRRTAYEVALKAASRIMPTSLLDYMR